MNALEYFMTHLKYERDPKIKEEISQKFAEYLKRAEEIRAVLDDPRPQPHVIQDPVKSKLFKEHAIDYLKRAVKEDNEMNYAKAFPLYMNALEYFKTYFKYESNLKIREAVQQKFSEYLRRAEELRVILDYGNPPQAQKASPSTEEIPQVSKDDSNTSSSG
ncbi:protein SUPPRESSOR OF K(+) TRANSPORT GROWTH DEFECT 1-like [Papaver somniferum]|uniref:protein SUPPRESSOR OF K(+) TRANSPORT GROWTH DEFECT 1-like n=1 Tax=Papaver somniferum TaxID=3469 RepID=UPI000E6FAEF7|nr:protein SUPPRESSOR OF K(+) TRANSPORT GROWTH DEFECT 1-like [Papaver somniferum]